jgi:hypothetical protein
MTYDQWKDTTDYSDDPPDWDWLSLLECFEERCQITEQVFQQTQVGIVQ